MLKGKVRNMFPGGNTSKGFFSFYSYIISQEEAKRIFILKGGPGVGKSTFMKKISETMVGLGYDTEQMHCSSDNNSLDGVVIPKVGIALIDGTAPHVCDPIHPGVVDEIIHLGDFWNEVGLRKGREQVFKIRKEMGSHFQRTYRYLKAALQMHEDSAVIYSSGISDVKINKIAKEYSDILFNGIPDAEKAGRLRCLFASAITPGGLKNYLDDLVTMDQIYTLTGFPGAGTEKVLEKIKTAALEKGFYTEAFYCAFDPDKLEHLIIPGLNTALTTSNKYHSTDACAIKKVDFNEMLNSRVLEKNKSVLEYNQKIMEGLLDKAVETLHCAKILHDEMETYYIPHMDFNAVQKCWEKTMQRILNYEDE